MKIFNKILIILIPAMVLFGCKKEDYTGHSSETPTSPTITVDVSEVPTSAVSDLTKSTYAINLTMDVAQIVDVKVHVTLDAENSTATLGEDFSYDGSAVIEAGRTSATLYVSILSDEIAEDEETFTLTIGDQRTANATISPVDVTFKISNATNTSLVTSLSWSSDVYDVTGNAIAPTDLADLVYSLVDKNTFEVILQEDGGSFESMILEDTLDDGDYLVMVSFYEAMDLGDQGGANLSLMLEFDQLGTQSGSLVAENALNTSSNLESQFFFAKITKAGSTWTVEDFEGFAASDLDFASDTWNDGLGDGWYPDYMYANQVVITGTTGSYQINGLGFAWMEGFWGETITDSTAVDITFSDDGTLEIADQYNMTTDYEGDPYDYNIYGTGTWNRKMLPVALNIQYQLDQDGFLPAQYYGGSQYNENDYFLADIIAAGAKGKTRTVSPKSNKKIK